MEISAQYPTVKNTVEFSDTEKACLRKARVGSYIIIPIRTAAEKITDFSLKKSAELLLDNGWTPYSWQYDDLYNHINSIFRYDPVPAERKRNAKEAAKIAKEASIGINFSLEHSDALRDFTQDPDFPEDQRFYVSDPDDPQADAPKLQFRFRCIQMTIMHTGIGFLVLGIEGPTAISREKLLLSGVNDNGTALGLVGKPSVLFDIGKFIGHLLKKVGMTDYSRYIEGGRGQNILRDAVFYSVATIPYSDNLPADEEKIKLLCRNIRQGLEMDTNSSEDSDETPHMTFAARNGDRIRWGVYSVFGRTAQVYYCSDKDKSGNPIDTLDPINIYAKNREDNYLPLTLLILYERYSYLFFNELLQQKNRGHNRKSKKEQAWLDEQMLLLKAYGVFMPGDLSPYNNVNQYLRDLREIYEIQETLVLIDGKIGMIAHIREEQSNSTQAWIAMVITLLGIVSIVCDGLGTLDALGLITSETPPEPLRIAAGLFFMVSLLLFIIIPHIRKRR